MVRRNITEELDGRGEGDPRIQEKSPQPVARKREKVASGFCHLMLSPAPRPQLHLCPWLPLWAPISIVMNFLFPPHTHTPGHSSWEIWVEGHSAKTTVWKDFILIQYLPETYSGS